VAETRRNRRSASLRSKARGAKRFEWAVESVIRTCKAKRVPSSDVNRHLRDLRQNQGDHTVTEYDNRSGIFYIVTKPKRGGGFTTRVGRG
jgi:hypothetical protein